jgi:hypothetical protein
MPGFRELQFLLCMFQAERRIPVSVVWDVSKAHRRVKIDPLEQGYQSCQLRPGEVWVNCEAHRRVKIDPLEQGFVCPWDFVCPIKAGGLTLPGQAWRALTC